MMTFISMRPAYIKRSISFVDRFTIQRSFYYFAYSIQLIDRYIELLLPLDPRPNLFAYTSFSTTSLSPSLLSVRTSTSIYCHLCLSASSHYGSPLESLEVCEKPAS